MISQLQEVHSELIDHVNNLPVEDQTYHPQGKWTALQHLAHILMSVRILQRTLMLPPFVIKAKYGLSNREGRTYDGLVKRYRERLAEGGKAPSPYAPKEIAPTELNALVKKLKKQIHLLSYRYLKLSDEKLNTYILPHPLLGKLTLKEMAFFTIYHAQHHQELIKKGLEAKEN